MIKNNNISKITSNLKNELLDLKSKQLFGDDSLEVKEWVSDVLPLPPNRQTNVRFIVRLTPLDDTGVLPCNFDLMYRDIGLDMPNYDYYQNAVFDGTGSFEWVVWSIYNIRTVTEVGNYDTRVRINYIGNAKITIREM